MGNGLVPGVIEITPEMIDAGAVIPRSQFTSDDVGPDDEVVISYKVLPDGSLKRESTTLFKRARTSP